MANNQAAALLNRGLQQLSNPSSVKAYTFMGVPLGSRLLIIKQDEIQLENPLIHIKDKLSNDEYSYQKSESYLSTGTKLGFDVLIYNPERNAYYAIDSTHSYNENNTRHYNLYQLDIGNILILNGLDDPRYETIQNELFDVISLPQLLKLFSDNNIQAYPKHLQVLNRELLEAKALFIQTLDSFTLANGFSKSIGLQRKDTIRIFYNNYTLEEIYDLFDKFQTFTTNGDISIMDGNIFELKQIEEDGLSTKIMYYSEFNINYILEPKNPVDLKKYIQSVMVNIKTIRENKDV